MKFLVIGSSGQLGSDYMRLLPRLGHDVEGLSRPEIDLACPASILEVLGRGAFDVVINVAAYHG